jgi:hypothetical protein
MSDARTVIAKALREHTRVQASLHCSELILAALAEAGFVLMKEDAVTKHKAWCPAMSQCECEGSE